MKNDTPLLTAQAPVLISGSIERIIYYNADNGWTVLRVKPLQGGEAISAVGSMPELQMGMNVRLSGDWVNNARFGKQLQVTSCESILPASAEGIRHYLGSGLIKGIRARMASRIVESFGEDTFAVLDTNPERLTEVKGISPKMAASIAESWADHQGIRDLIMFLQPHGVSTAYAVRIFKHYGAESLSVVRDNPYRLAMDIHGIGFLTADAVAMKLGFLHDSDLRAEAAVLYTLQRLAEDGHVYYPLEELVEKTAKDLNIPEDKARDAVQTLEQGDWIIVEDLGDHEGVYLSRLHHCESRSAYYLRRLLRSPKSVHFPHPKESLQTAFASLPITLAEEQEAAVAASLKNKVLVITGGPGTGKTTIIKAIIKTYETQKAKILLAAPTGRAAKRMAEATGLEAKTIHRLLEYSPMEDGFARNENNPLACGLLVVDEVSMMDILLMYHLLKATPFGATVILVGDVNQLPSVGAGTVLQDIMRSGVVPVAELIEVFRQAAESDIIMNAHRINRGEIPSLQYMKDKKSDFYFFAEEDPDKAADLIVDLVANRIPRHFGFDPVDDIQVLTPMHKGSAGAAALNVKLQTALNRQPLQLQRGERIYRLDDKVMQIRNNYDKDVFNGDIGRICYLDVQERELTVRFDERNVLYSFEELEELVPAYAISVHKSQGSEYPVIVLPVLTQHYILLQRNLLYTGVTRGKKLVVLVGTAKALAMAVNNNQTRKRNSWLAQRLTLGVDI